MTIKTYVCNPFQENTYIVYDETKEAIIFDPGMGTEEEKNRVKRFITQNDLIVKRLIYTHLHFDHMLGNSFVVKEYGLSVEAGQEDLFLLDNVEAQIDYFHFPMSGERFAIPKVTKFITEEQVIKVGNMEFVAYHVPGHSPGSYAFYNKSAKKVIVGDVLFGGSIGRTDLPKGSYQQLVNSIQTQLMILPDDTEVYPGHGQPTSIGRERKYNPFL